MLYLYNMINDFFNYSKHIFESYIHGENPKKKILVDVFNEISNTLMDASIDMESNKNPEDSCERLSVLRNAILNELKPYRKDKDIIKLYVMLDICDKINKKYNNNQLKSVISDLRRSSSEFKALSFAIRN